MRRIPMMLLAAGSAGLLLVGATGCATTSAGSGSATPSAAASAAAAAAVADMRRPEADRTRDALRKPAETVAFAGVRPGSRVAELNAGRGYYTRVLAGTVGPTGKVYVILPATTQPATREALEALKTTYGNIELVTGDNLTFKTPEPVDVAWTTENYHDFHNGPTANIAALNSNVFANLKPGGIFFVEDHAAAPGAGLAAAAHGGPAGRGRMDEAVAKSELTAAGFRFEAESNHLRHPEDNKDGPAADSGPSTSDRFAFRFRKPR